MSNLNLSKLRAEGLRRGLVAPSKRALDVYGLTEREWYLILSRQGWKCPVCLKEKFKANIDHEHVIGWKKMPPQKRKLYVRGVLCWSCNRHVVGSHMKAAMAQRIADYIRTYEVRRKGLSG